MKKRTGKIAMLCMSALLFVQAMPVWAAGETEIALNPGKAQEGGQVQVACEITDGREVTNGKIRIHYDASKIYPHCGQRRRGRCPGPCVKSTTV